ESSAVILDLELQPVVLEPQADPCPIGTGMTRDVAQRFLQHSVYVDAHGAVHRTRGPVPLIRYGDTSLALNGREVPVDRSLEPGGFERRRMQRLRQPSHVVEGRLRDLADLVQLRLKRRIGRGGRPG